MSSSRFCQRWHNHHNTNPAAAQATRGRHHVRHRCAGMCAMLVALLMLAACGKEQPQWVEVVQEQYGGPKVLIDGFDALWVDGDAMLLNGTPVQVRRIDGHAYIPSTAVAQTNCAFYPQHIAVGGAGAGVAEVVLPASYHYNISGGKQQIGLPMAAYTTSATEVLHFRHLTGALSITIKNMLPTNLCVDSIVVESNAYRLCGTYSIDMRNLTQVAAVACADADARRVAMLFDDNGLELSGSEQCSVLVPVAAVGDDNHFTITVVAHHQNVRYTFAQTQATGGALPRNVLGFAAVTVDASVPNGHLFAGQGTQGNPFVISTAADFALMAQACAEGWNLVGTTQPYNQCHYSVANNIDMRGQTVPTIATLDGSINGNGHTVAHFVADGAVVSGTAYCGLVGQLLSGATVKNLHLADVTLQCSASASNLRCGTVVAQLSSASIDACSATGTVFNLPAAYSQAYCGGLVGEAIGAACSVQNSTYSGALQFASAASSTSVSPLVGYVTNRSNTRLDLSACTVQQASIGVQSTSAVNYGGFVGVVAAGCQVQIEGCSFGGDATVESSGSTCIAGGAAGRMLANTSRLVVEGCSLSGTLQAVGNASGSYAGRVVGYKNNTFSNSATNTVAISVSLNAVGTSSATGN